MKSKSREIEVAFNRRLRILAEQFRNEHAECAGYEIRPTVRVYRKRPRGFHGHQLRVAKGFLSQPSFLALTNAGIIERLADWYAPYKPSLSIMYVTLSAASRRDIQAELDRAGIAARLTPTDTLSSLKRIVRARGRAVEKAVTKGSLEVGPDWVVAGGRQFAIDKSRKYPSIRVTLDGKRQYVRCDVLAALLDEAT